MNVQLLTLWHDFWLTFASQVDVNMLHLDPCQYTAVIGFYHRNENFHEIFHHMPMSQQHATTLLHDQGLVLEQLDDLGNHWSTRWSMKDRQGRGTHARVLLQW